MAILCYTSLTCAMEGGVFLSPSLFFLLIAQPLRHSEVKASAKVNTPHSMPRIHRLKRACTLALSFLAFVFFCMHIYGFGPFNNWIIAFSALMHSIAYYRSYKLCAMEYRRYLPQACIGSRGFWFFGGIEGIGRILFYATISDFDFMNLYCPEARPVIIKQFYEWLQTGNTQMMSTNGVTSGEEVTQPSENEVTQFAEEGRFLDDNSDWSGSEWLGTHADSRFSAWSSPVLAGWDSSNAVLPMETLAKKKKKDKSQQNESENDEEDSTGSGSTNIDKKSKKQSKEKKANKKSKKQSKENKANKKSKEQSKKNKTNDDESTPTSENSSNSNSENETTSSNGTATSSTGSSSSEATDDTLSDSTTSGTSSPEEKNSRPHSTAAKQTEGRWEGDDKSFIPNYREVAFLHLLYELFALLFGAFQIILMYLVRYPHDLSVELLGGVEPLLAPEKKESSIRKDKETSSIRDKRQVNTVTSIRGFDSKSTMFRTSSGTI